MFSSLIFFFFYLFFLYISFGTFFGQGIAPASQRGVKWYNQNMESDIYGNTALPLAPDLQNLQTPQNTQWIYIYGRKGPQDKPSKSLFFLLSGVFFLLSSVTKSAWMKYL